MDSAELKSHMIANLERICGHLLPNGRIEKGGKNYEAHNLRDRPSSAASSRSYSLKVQLRGDAAGRFVDMSDKSGTKGDCIALWMAVRGLQFRDAKSEICAFLGLPDVQNFSRKTAGNSRKSATTERPLRDQFKAIVQGGAVWKWLVDVRGIEPDTIKAYKIGQWTGTPKGEDAQRTACVFPYFTPAGHLARYKKRDWQDKSYMRVWPSKGHGGEPLLFGWQVAAPALEASSQPLAFITEGELDAMALHTARGWPAMSVPFGAGDGGKIEWLETNFDALSRYERIYLFFDSDKAGQNGKEEIVRRLGYHRCHWIRWPREGMDCNAALLEGWTNDQWLELLSAAEEFDPTELAKPSDFARDIWEIHHPPGGEEPGVPMPFSFPWRARPHEWTVHQGLDGGGKTTGIFHCLTSWAARGQRALIMSFEMPPAEIFACIQRQATARQKPDTEAEHMEEIEWLDQHFLLFNHIGEASSDDIFALIEYCSRKYGIAHVLIDSLMCVSDVPEEDWEGQKKFVNRIDAVAQKYPIHLHLVAHSKKPSSKTNPKKQWPSKHDVKGSGAITARAWNVVCWWRNGEKADAWSKIGEFEQEATGQDDLMLLADMKADARKMFDGRFDIQKQRKTGQLAVAQIFFDSASRQFRQRLDDPVINYMNLSQRDMPL